MAVHRQADQGLELLCLDPALLRGDHLVPIGDSAWTGLILSGHLQLQEFWEVGGLYLGAPVTPGFSQSQSQILAQLQKGRRPSVPWPPQPGPIVFYH